MPTATSPIGIFDSGVGGLTVARAVMEQLPQESVIYTGDTAHSPYGPRPISEVRAFSQDVADRLVERGCKMLVIACNTATAAFLHDARERYDIPIVEVIRPAVRRAMSTTRNGKIGVIGTEGTIKSGAYQDLFALNPKVQAFATACPDFVPFVERGITAGRQILGSHALKAKVSDMSSMPSTSSEDRRPRCVGVASGPKHIFLEAAGAVGWKRRHTIREGKSRQ